MHCNLPQLPAELLRMIIGELLRWDDGEKFVGEPVTIYHSLINWSCTCSYFRHLLAPHIFKSVKLVNKENSGSSLIKVAKGQHNVHVKELYFVGSALGDVHSEATAFTDTEGIFPRYVRDLICELQRFPSLEKLSLGFDYPPDDISARGWVEHIFTEEEETPEQVLEAEASLAYRALMSRTFSALTQNKPPHFKHLEIRNLIWKDVSTYKQAAFHDFLGRLEQLTFSIHAKESLEGWKLDRSLMGKLDEYFFNHLANITTLSIKDPVVDCLWLDQTTYAPLALKVDQMPLLTTLHLEYILATPELADFLVGHKYTLEEVILRDCYASTGGSSTYYLDEIDNGIRWSQFFTSLVSACPAQLHRFELICSSLECLSSNLIDWEEGYENIRTMLRQNPRRVLFPYGVRDREWLVRFDWRECLAAFLRGEDQRSWDRLQELVQGNAKKAAKSESKGAKLQVRS
ncbi:hypothetical protein MMC22_002250 [Lobaria immixta]|nr:hypothetical protein [Lobaria immixta]